MFLDLLWIVVKILLIVLPLMFSVAYLTYAERKIIGYMQVRCGPNRVGPYGLLQPIADAVKLLFKEIIIPSSSNKFLFVIAPILAIAPALAAWAVIPFGEIDVSTTVAGKTTTTQELLVLADIDASLLYILALTSIGVYGVIVAGWASNSKYAFLGSMRSAAQIVSYEIAMGFALVGVLMAASVYQIDPVTDPALVGKSAINLGVIVKSQSGGFWHWYWLPLMPLFIVYLVSGVAETNRAPFDVAEGESEIVAGFHVEYSGMAFAVFFLAEYAVIILISMLCALLFCGGWLSPFEGIPHLEEWFAWVPGLVWLIMKTMFFMFCFLWFRATFPRYRYDQIMRLGWKVFIPVTIVWIVVLAAAIAYELPPWFDQV